MSLTLSSTDVVRLSQTLETLVSPLRFARPDLWIAEAMSQYAALQGADQVIAITPSNGGLVAVGQGAHWDAAVRTYLEYYHALEAGIYHRLAAQGHEVYNRAIAYGKDRVAMKPYDEFHRDWAMVHRLCDVVGMSVPSPLPAPFCLHAYHDDDRNPFGERGFAIAQIVAPAFRAGIRTWMMIESQRRALLDCIDGMPDAAMIVTRDGEVVHANERVEKMLRGDPASQRLREAMIRAARSVAARAAGVTLAVTEPPSYELTTPVAVYRVLATVVPEGHVGPAPAGLATLIRTTPVYKSAAAMASEFGLTPRETEVAMLLVSRHRNPEIAETLGISVHTASRHVESVLKKLGLRSRNEVRERLQL